jgi:hypothetical protein
MRLWVEWSGDSPLWRGSIEHLQSGARLTFQDLEQVEGFIQKQIGASNEEKTETKGVSLARPQSTQS